MFLLVSVLVGFNWLSPMFVKPKYAPVQDQALMDEYMLGATAVRYDEHGNIAERLHVDNINHIQSQDYMTLHQPILMMKRDQMTWHVKAKTGKSYREEENHFTKIVLNEDVEIQIDQTTPGSWVLRTQELSLLPKEEIAYTDETVTISSNQLNIEGQGMQGDMKSGEIQLKHQVKTRYDAN